MPPKRILVTGTSGLVGNAIACRLAADGRSVVGLDLSAPSSETAPFQVVVANINDIDLLARLIDDHRIEAIVHCAGVSSSRLFPDDPYRVCEANVFGAIHMLEVARLRKIKRFVHCSSASVYGNAPSDGPLTEEAAFQPAAVYGATKAASDLLLRAYRVQYGLDGVALRIRNVYGPGRMVSSDLTAAVEAGLAGEPRTIDLVAKARAQYIYIDDVVDALRLALDHPSFDRHAYNIAGPGFPSNAELVAIVNEVIKGARVSLVSNAGAPAHLTKPLDIGNAQREIGFSPAFDLRRGIAVLAEWLRTNS